MDLLIEFLSNDPQEIWNMPALEGGITIGDFQERFISSLIGDWTESDYLKQWGDGLERLKKHNESCLVASVQKASLRPKVLGLVNLWALYKQGDIIYVQNMFLCGKVYDMYIGNGEFTPGNCYKYIPTRRTHATNGMKVSEWHTDFQDVPMNYEQDPDLLYANKFEPIKKDGSIGQIAFNRQGDDMRHIVASADPQNGGYWNLYIEGRRVGVFSDDLKTRTGD